MQIEELYTLFLTYPKIETDTRKEVKQSLFFCLSGENFNGNQFADEATEKGAAYVIVDDKNYWRNDSRWILVDHSLNTLQELALYHRNQFKIPIIGITGSNGKTTSKELIAAVLSTKYNTIATQGNLNNHIGVPLTLLRLTSETEIAVIEMGANHPDEIAFLCALSLPTFGLITNIGKAHLEGFGSLEIIKRTKLALYKSVANQKGKLFVNFDDQLLKQEAQAYSAVSYGKDNIYDFHGRITKEYPFLAIEWGFKNKDSKHTINSRLFGNYNFPNLMAAVAIGNYFDISPEQIAFALAAYQPQNNRSQLIKGKQNELIMDAYNANPESLKLALANFERDEYPKKVVILGDMFELGDYAFEEHKIILDSLLQAHFGKVILIGSIFKQFEKKYTNFVFFENTADFIQNRNQLNIKNMRVLIKGSRGIKLETIQKYLL
ncbi:MAG: UDP-N-acetylmuramoyl-tripeptide--D-alanyl-D-alanine ligase [Bacteroidales bacterium]|nr:UDP-N-acetylmuramoyl-tripeptide--D-alanyl-D-alanine ligase [Bacteroidales bacterium]